ncbi:hypothetical protein DV515_00001290 [Chloebia gouldiae]|uniref:Uncharacterized protein n=1 Tax=Chloebia gouldiae TaxID=44316 RepID=A0A3L8SYR4_CHLGU|nr:hypothetical protein DV515_00001290 [Chloebia gouldiae]
MVGKVPMISQLTVPPHARAALCWSYACCRIGHVSFSQAGNSSTGAKNPPSSDSLTARHRIKGEATSCIRVASGFSFNRVSHDAFNYNEIALLHQGESDCSK